jgi:uncharacterized protein (DUF58 family)
VLTYNLWRVALFCLCFALGRLAGLRSILLFVAAFLVSGVLSLFVLSNQRAAMGRVVERMVARVESRIEASAAAEDEYVDGMRDGAERASGDQPAS